MTTTVGFTRPAQRCTAPAGILFSFFFYLIKQLVSNTWCTRFPLKCFLKKQYRVDSGLPAWCCTQFETSRIPPIFSIWVSSSLKQSLHSLPDEVKPKWCETACENVCACFMVKKVSVWFTVGLCPEIPPNNSSMCMCLWMCVFLCHLIGLLVTSLSESLFTSQWPVRGSSCKCHHPPALSMFP